jgi:hypothetical protein
MSKFNTLFNKLVNENTSRPPLPYEPMKSKSFAVGIYLGRESNKDKQTVFKQIKEALMSADKAEEVTSDYAQSTVPPNWAAATKVTPYEDTLQNGSSMLEMTITFPPPSEMGADRFDESIISDVVRSLGFKSVFVNPIGFY